MAVSRSNLIEQIAAGQYGVLPPVNQAVADRAIRHAIRLEAFKDTVGRDIVRFLDKQVLPDLVSTIEQRLSRLKSRGFDRGPWTTQRYRDLLVSTNKTLGVGVRGAREMLSKELRKFAVAEAEMQKAMLKKSLPLDFNLRTPDPQMLRSIVTSNPIQGRILKDWFSSIGKQTASKIQAQINIGLALGETPRQMVKRIQMLALGNAFPGQVSHMRRHIMTVVRTSTAHVANHARRLTYLENKDLIKAWKYLATLDARTTDICRSYDGQVFQLSEGPWPPNHHQCRSISVPVTKSWKELGMKVKDLPASTRASMNGQVPSTMTYGPWLRTQPAAIQNEALGVTRAALFRQGKVDIQSFVGPNGRRLNLRGLMKKEGLSYEEVFPRARPRVAEPARAPAQRQPSVQRSAAEIDDIVAEIEALTVESFEEMPGWVVEHHVSKGGTPWKRFIHEESGFKTRSLKKTKEFIKENPQHFKKVDPWDSWFRKKLKLEIRGEVNEEKMLDLVFEKYLWKKSEIKEKIIQRIEDAAWRAGADKKEIDAFLRGWNVEQRVTPSGTKYQIFTSPDGQKLRSVKEMEKWFANKYRSVMGKADDVVATPTKIVKGKKPPTVKPEKKLRRTELNKDVVDDIRKRPEKKLSKAVPEQSADELFVQLEKEVSGFKEWLANSRQVREWDFEKFARNLEVDEAWKKYKAANTKYSKVKEDAIYKMTDDLRSQVIRGEKHRSILQAENERLRQLETDDLIKLLSEKDGKALKSAAKKRRTLKLKNDEIGDAYDAWIEDIGFYRSNSKYRKALDLVEDQQTRMGREIHARLGAKNPAKLRDGFDMNLEGSKGSPGNWNKHKGTAAESGSGLNNFNVRTKRLWNQAESEIDRILSKNHFQSQANQRTLPNGKPNTKRAPNQITPQDQVNPKNAHFRKVRSRRTGRMEVDERAYHLDMDIVVSNRSVDQKTIAHEIGHAIELNVKRQYPERWQKLMDFLKDRMEMDLKMRGKAGGVTQLKKLHPNSSYKAHEITVEDLFNSDYMGKIYSSRAERIKGTGVNKAKKIVEKVQAQDIRASELTSMAIQEMAGGSFERIGMLVGKDPEYFSVILDLLRGTGRFAL